jgi:high-affinity K+ transport system ATPase subunit B
MPPNVFLVALLSTVGIAAFTVIMVARVIANRGRSSSPDVEERLVELEGTVEHLQRELGETQQRLDFAERLLTAAKEQRPRS